MQKRTYARGRKQICSQEVVNIPRSCRERFLSLDRPHLKPLLDAQIDFAGMGVLGKGYRIERIDPRWHTLLYTLKGRGHLVSDGKSLDLHPGYCCVAPAHCSHEYWITEAPWTVAWFCMPQRNRFHWQPHQPVVFPSTFADLLAPLIQQALDGPNRGGHQHPKIMNRCARLLIDILRHDIDASSGPVNQKIRKKLDAAFSEVKRNPAFAWNSSSLIERAHLPFQEDRMRQLCKEVYGQTPMRRVRTIRMEIAQELLTETNYPLRIIAPMLGYRNEFAFSAAFSKELGMPPKSFRDSGTSSSGGRSQL